MYFRANLKKNQEKPKVLSKTLEKTQGHQKKNQEPKIASKNPRSWEKTQAVATLGIVIKSQEKTKYYYTLFMLDTFKSTHRIKLTNRRQKHGHNQKHCR